MDGDDTIATLGCISSHISRPATSCPILGSKNGFIFACTGGMITPGSTRKTGSRRAKRNINGSSMMKRFVASVVMFFAIALAFAEDIRIASYNMMRLGNGTKDYTTLASVVDDFDVVGAIEVMNPKGMALLAEKLPANWSYVVADHAVGDKSYKEYYGFFYDDKVEVVQVLGYYSDERNAFMRPPFAVQFRVKSTGFVFNLVIAHIIYGDSPKVRLAEINHLGEVYSYFEGLTGNQGITLIAGDFNEESLAAFKSLINFGMSELGTVKKSTLGKTGAANDYDHMFASKNLIPMIVESDVYYWTSDWSTRKTVSDHFPVYCVLETE